LVNKMYGNKKIIKQNKEKTLKDIIKS